MNQRARFGRTNEHADSAAMRAADGELTLKTFLYRSTTVLSVLGLSILPALASAVGDAPLYRAELVFPLRREHNPAPGLVECSNGDLIASWYRGGGNFEHGAFHGRDGKSRKHVTFNEAWVKQGDR
jgi:hypothetical protein